MAKVKQDLSGIGSNIRTEREYAKTIGVRSPTMLSKAQLDEAVRRRELELGITKNKHNIYEFLPDERFSLCSKVGIKTRIQMFSGYFCPFPEGDGVLRRDPFVAIPETDVYVSADFVREFSILSGDRVVGNVSRVNYNNIRVLKSVRYVSEQPTSRCIVRDVFEKKVGLPASCPIRLKGNEPLLGIINDVLCFGVGQSLAVYGDVKFSDALSVLKSLYTSFDGVVYSAFTTPLSNDEKGELLPLINPETLLIGNPEQLPFLFDVLKRHAETGEHIAVLLYSSADEAQPFISEAKNCENCSLTVIAFTHDAPSQATAKMEFSGDNVIVNSLVNTGSAYIVGSKQRKVFRALSKVRDGVAERVLSDFLAEY